tara:strand:+ start:973 stop:1350 length:378 start_codon:yes stop_codon:yes gene_type:complete
MTYKKTLSKFLAGYNRKIGKDMSIWIKYRPSRWGDFVPEKFIGPLLKFINKKGGKKVVLILTFILSLIFVGVMPTLNFIWSNIFRIWLILLVIPLLYWTLAIFSVYTRVLVQAIFDALRAILADS